MAGLKLCGVEVPITEASRSDYVAEDRGRAFDGTPRSVIRARKRDLQLRAGPKSATWTDALRRLVNGEGHSFSFDVDLYSSKGLGGTASGEVTPGHTAVYAPKHGAGKLFVQIGASVVWATALGSSWTAMIWRNAGSWQHYVIRSDGAKWVDGVRNDAAATAWLSVSSGSLTLAGASGTTLHADDLVALPFVVPDDWPSQLRTEHNARAFPSLPRLRAEGDLINAGPITALGQSSDAEVFSFMDGGSLVAAGESLSFGLSEV